jgi:glycosyltransferase involved in cell wall biosynthesis
MQTSTDSPKLLLFFLSGQDTYRKPLFSPSEIFCGPDAADRIVGGRVLSLKTPLGRFDAAEIAGRIPASQLPDLLIVKADATRRNLPRNLQAFKCPKVLIVGDTHHMRAPLRTVIAYALSEPFDFVVFDHTRHHAPWFAQAGVRNLHWLPALDFGFTARDLRSTHGRPLTFVGGVGKWHPWRRAVLSQVQKAGLPLEVLQGTLEETADIYADSRVTLNVSLNGDLNLRVFEALGAGGFLLTDELPAASGLPLLFQAGKHLDVWRSPGELIEKIRHYLGRPAESARIRAAGREEVLQNHHPDMKKRELFDLVFHGRCNPRYELGLGTNATRSFPAAGSRPPQVPGIAAYEWIQEIHRGSRSTTVYGGPAALARLGDSPDLPRLYFRGHETIAPCGEDEPGAGVAPAAEILWLDDADAGQLSALISRFTGSHVIASNAAAQNLGAWGFVAAEQGDDGLSLYGIQRAALFLKQAWDAGEYETVRLVLPRMLRNSQTASDCLGVAECAGLLKNDELFAAALRKAVALDRDCQPAMIRLACVAMEKKDGASAALALEEAVRCAPLPAAVDRLRRELRATHAERLLPYLGLTGQTRVARAQPPLRVLVVTNLFPPQELGGYGRMIWEFARGLLVRGHAVRVLAGNADYLGKTPAVDEVEMEARVSRALNLTGRWVAGGVSQMDDPAQLAATEGANASKVLQEAFAFEPDFVLVGNLDLLGVGLIHSIIYAGYPVLHAVANKLPGFPPRDQPLSSSYWVAPCSDWNGRALKQNGYEAGHTSTVYPGARIDRFFRAFLPDTQVLRIAYASIVAPYKGTHVLVEALARLQATGCRFTAEIAGEVLDPAFGGRLKTFCAESGLSGRVTFAGFLNRKGLSSLFARSNVLVFPSQFEEPFGISQVEAMASGLVVVTSGTGGASEIVRDGVDGLVFKGNDPASLAEKLLSLARDPALFQKLQSAGQKRALCFSLDASIRKIESLAGELIEGSKALTVEQAAVAEVEIASLQGRFGHVTARPSVCAVADRIEHMLEEA